MFIIFSGTFVTQIRATDADAKNEYGTGYGDIGYFLESEFFRIDQQSGKIFVKKEGLDREQSMEYEVTVCLNFQ